MTSKQFNNKIDLILSGSTGGPDAAREVKKAYEELQRTIKVLIETCEGLAGQQAMDDNWWVEPCKNARKLIGYEVEYHNELIYGIKKLKGDYRVKCLSTNIYSEFMSKEDAEKDYLVCNKFAPGDYKIVKK